MTDPIISIKYGYNQKFEPYYDSFVGDDMIKHFQELTVDMDEDTKEEFRLIAYKMYGYGYIKRSYVM